jgi:hypothetical protein
MPFGLVCRYQLIKITVNAQINGADTFKSNVIIDILNKAIKDKNKSELKCLYLNMDVREKKIFSDGMGYFPMQQDTILINDTSTENLISSSLVLSGLLVQLIKVSDIGKINRKELLAYILNFKDKKPIDNRLTVYVEIGQPIDGWDIVGILRNNYWLKKYGKDTSGIREAVLYLPVVLAYYNYRTNVLNERLIYKFIGSTSLYIE